MMMHIAFKLGVHEYRGPDWTNDTYFAVSAKVPENTTREQLDVMFRNLVVQRIQLRVHFEKKEMRGGGPKMKEASKEPINFDRPPPEFKVGADGYPELPPGRRPAMLSNGRRSVLRCARESMDAFASELSGYAGQPVTDATGLKCVYDFVLRWAQSHDPSAPADGEVGLKLEPRKVINNVFVVDHIKKNPIAN